jgi:hypothetical protein
MTSKASHGIGWIGSAAGAKPWPTMRGSDAALARRLGRPCYSCYSQAVMPVFGPCIPRPTRFRFRALRDPCPDALLRDLLA